MLYLKQQVTSKKQQMLHENDIVRLKHNEQG